MDDFIIVTENLIKHYKSAFGRNGVVEAVRGINLAVKRGEIFGLVGPDGAGKTTTIQMLCGILDPTSGRATVAGFDTVKEAAAIGERIGYMSEGFTLYGTLTVDENLEFFADLYKVPPEERQWRKEELLHFSRLTPFAVEGLRRTLPSVEDVFIAAITETEQKELRELRELPSGPSVPSVPSVPSDDYAVTVSGLTKRFDDFTAVDNVTFQVKPGEIFGFLGPNGAGKTTVIRMLCGLLPPTAGTGTVAGHNWPLYLGFRGGRGISPFMGMRLVAMLAGLWYLYRRRFALKQ